MNKISNGSLRIGGFLSDALLLAQLISLGGLLIWQTGAQANWAGFAVIGGAVAGVISVFAFILFGVLSWFWNAAAFWRTFHPLNLSLAMLGGAVYGMLYRDKMMVVAVAAGIGLAAAIIFCKKFPRRPRLWIACCLALMFLRYLIHWRFSIAAGGASFVFFLWAHYNFGDAHNKNLSADSAAS